MAAHALTRWEPENPAFWETEGRGIASRNLWISIPALALSFAIWMIWSVAALYLPRAGFHFATEELFLLAALPSLCGATLRIVYALVAPRVGARRWTVWSTASLLLPTLAMGFAVQDPGTSYSTFVVLSLLSGLGGGNFASSMANIHLFFPEAQKGTALSVNAGLGNLGVSLAQFVVPLAVTASIVGAAAGAPQVDGSIDPLWLQNAGYIWVPLIVLCVLAALLGMNDLARPRATPDRQRLMHRLDSWAVCWLYLGTFGSFIGYAAALPLLIDHEFPRFNALSYAWLGPLLGALIRPLGGWLSDYLGAARVTFWSFVAMAAATSGILWFLPHGETSGSFAGFLVSVMLVFVATGIGNGSTFRMIAAVVRPERAEHGAAIASVLAFSSAIGAYGGFLIPMAFAAAISLSGTPHAALVAFIGFYLTCIALSAARYWRTAANQAAMP